MIVNTKKPIYVYVKNTRVCGSSLVKMAVRRKGFNNLLIPQNHISFTQVQQVFEDFFRIHGIAKRIEYISVVRNPYPHTISYWLFTRWKYNRTEGLEEYLMKDIQGICRLQQHQYVFNYLGERVDHLLRFEDGNVIQRVLNIAGIKCHPRNILHTDKARYEKPWQEYYDPTTIELVQEKFAKDFERLEYDKTFPC